MNKFCYLFILYLRTNFLCFLSNIACAFFALELYNISLDCLCCNIQHRDQVKPRVRLMGRFFTECYSRKESESRIIFFSFHMNILGWCRIVQIDVWICKINILNLASLQAYTNVTAHHYLGKNNGHFRDPN